MFKNLQTKPESRSITFETHNIEPSIVNAIRRAMITDIPVVGFRGEDDPSLEVLKNNGPLHNEILLHRLGLIPIHFTDEEVEAFDAEKYEFELNVDNQTNAMVNVTTKDLTVKKNDKELSAKEVHRLFPPNPITKHHVLITRLRKGEHLHVKGIAVRDTARTHAGFSPGFCTCFPMEDPVLAARAVGVLDKERAYARNEYGDPTVYQFTIETECGLTPKYLMFKTLEMLKAKLQGVTQELYQDTSDKVAVKAWKNDSGLSGCQFEFKGEDDTLGYLLQSHMHQYYIREKKLTELGKEVTYVGYVCPHPLEAVMHLRMVFAEESTLTEYVEALAEQCRRVIANIQVIEADWIRFHNE